MPVISSDKNIPIYNLQPDVTGNRHLRIYNFEGTLPDRADLLVPHRKNFYLLAFIRQGDGRQWIDAVPYMLKSNTVYITGPDQVIVKEEYRKLWSTGIAFTKEALLYNGAVGTDKLPVLQNINRLHELVLTNADIRFIEDSIVRVTNEYNTPGEWQHQMIAAHLTVLLTYLSRLYTQQQQIKASTPETGLLENLRAKINENYYRFHEVADYAAMLNISAGYLSETVKVQSGQPAIKHIHEKLVLEARRLLFHTGTSVKEIAFSLGFADASYFTRFFKRETGTTPDGYRTATREMYR